MISVALCTYNGDRFITEQLHSILNQSIPVDEIVVCDDASSDNTLEIVRTILEKEFKGKYRIFCNEANLGPSRNFIQAIGHCAGEIIFLSDQDDVWRNDKVEKVVTWFDHHSDKDVLFTDAGLINALGKIVGKFSLWDSVGFTVRARRMFDKGFGIELFACDNRATGATMALRKSFVKENPIDSIISPYILHDGAIAMLALGKRKLGYLPERLIDYRLHAGQCVGLTRQLSDDVRKTSALCGVWSQLSLSASLGERLAFAALRLRIKHQIGGGGRIIRNHTRYHSFYQSYAYSFMCYDVMGWMKNLLLNRCEKGIRNS